MGRDKAPDSKSANAMLINDQKQTSFTKPLVNGEENKSEKVS